MNKLNIYKNWKLNHYNLVSLLEKEEHDSAELNLIKELVNKNYLHKFNSYYNSFENLDYDIDEYSKNLEVSEEDNEIFQIFHLITSSSDEIFSIIKDNHFYEDDALSNYVMYFYFYKVNDIDDFKNTIKIIFESLKNFDKHKEVIINSILRNNNNELFDWFLEYSKETNIKSIFSAMSYPKVQFKTIPIQNKVADDRNVLSFKKMFDFYVQDMVNQKASDYKNNHEELTLFDLVENTKTIGDYFKPNPEIFNYVINYFSKKFNVKEEFSIIYLYSKKIQNFYGDLKNYKDNGLYRSDIMTRRMLLRYENKFKDKISNAINEKNPLDLYRFLQSINIEQHDFIKDFKLYASLKEYVEINLEIKNKSNSNNVITKNKI